ncbi:hypothetical protein CBM2633_B10580 [Cupriavidus taiwanensis]|nr:hypothetical protein CBM2626_B140113 [Cupriavidus taiwanensis]SPA18350.1 hypothetical protein CBM2633_B10580 [Cupriavidus taiwanensis]
MAAQARRRDGARPLAAIAPVQMCNRLLPPQLVTRVVPQLVPRLLPRLPPSLPPRLRPATS